MSGNEQKIDAPVQQVDDKKDSRRDKVTDYLQAPRRKRRSYVLMALGSGTQGLYSGMDQYIRANFKNIAVAQPRSVDELVKNFNRQIMLLVLDDEFIGLKEGLALVAELKKRKNGGGIPVLFLTRQPEQLIEAYNQVLLPYQEGDEYLDWTKAEPAHVHSKIKAGLTQRYQRRSRRYKVDIVLRYYLLADDQMHTGRLVDLSVHGALLKAEDGRIFRSGDQLKIFLPIGSYLTGMNDDFLRIAARVRRVFIGGNQVGISFEHMSDAQMTNLTTYIVNLVNEQMLRRNAAGASRAKGGRL